MKECPKCEVCYEDNVNFCPIDQTQTRLSLPGGRLLANRYLLEKTARARRDGTGLFGEGRKSGNAARCCQNRASGHFEQ